MHVIGLRFDSVLFFFSLVLRDQWSDVSLAVREDGWSRGRVYAALGPRDGGLEAVQDARGRIRCRAGVFHF